MGHFEVESFQNVTRIATDELTHKSKQKIQKTGLILCKLGQIETCKDIWQSAQQWPRWATIWPQ